MPVNVFVSFDHDDQKQVAGFRGLVNNPNHPLDFHDHSLREPVVDRAGRPIKSSPDDPRSESVRSEIIRKFRRASKMVVLIGDDTYKSDWVRWEIQTFYSMKKQSSEDNTWKRIRGMRLKGAESAPIPRALEDRSTKVMSWDPKTLDDWLDLNPDG